MEIRTAIFEPYNIGMKTNTDNQGDKNDYTLWTFWFCQMEY